MRDRWLTPDELPNVNRCWAISIPDSIEFLAILKGCIDELRFSSNFEAFGSLSPDVVASAFGTAFDTIKECRVTGEIIAYATTNPPAGTLACDGSSYLRADYPTLYSVLNAAFITDADHFVVPDLRGRVIVGIGQGAGLTSRAMDDIGGSERVVLDVSEMPSHSHSEVTAIPTLINGGLEAPASSALPDVSITGSAGSGASHENMSPFVALGYAIAY